MKETNLNINEIAKKIKTAYPFWDVNVWENYGKQRIYIGKHGYVELTNGKIEPKLRTLRDTTRINELFGL